MVLTRQTISTAYATVTEQLRQAIVSGALPAGERLVLRDLAEQLGVSVTPVREALRELSAEGLVDFDAFKSTIVHSPTPQELIDVYEMRRALVPLAVRRSVEHMTEEQVQQGRRICAEMQSEPDLAKWLTLNRRFHQLLDGAAQSPQLTTTLSRLAALSALYVNLALPQRPEQRAGADREHKALMAAYARRDVDKAVELALAHLRQTLDAAMKVLGVQAE